MPPSESAEMQGPPTLAQAQAEGFRRDNTKKKRAGSDFHISSHVHHRIGMEAAAILYFFAILFDILSVFPFVNFIIDPIAQFIIGGIFVLNGVSLWERGFLWRFFTVSLIEFLPFVSIIPAFWYEVSVFIALSRAADQVLATATKVASKAVGERAASLGVGLAYRGIASGEIPLKKPESFKGAYQGVTQAIQIGAREYLKPSSFAQTTMAIGQMRKTPTAPNSIDGIRTATPLSHTTNDNKATEHLAA